jgi:hypothetical protein
MTGLAIAAWPDFARAQNFQGYFPSGNAGYDQQLGVTVLSRLHPLYDTANIDLGAFVISPSLDEGLTYNSNVNGAGAGAWASQTTGSITAGSNWARNSLGGSVGFTHYEYFGGVEPAYTDWNVGLGGGYMLGDDEIDAAYSHQSYHQLGASIGMIRSETPVQDETDSAHLSYTINLNRFSITPDITASAYRFGTSTVGTVQLNQQFLDRDVLSGGITGRYTMSDEGGLLLVLRGVSSDYIQSQPGQPSNNSDSFVLLGGIDLQPEGVWRYRLLVGVEVRKFQSSQFPTHTAPVIESSVIWSPTAMTTVTGTLSREIEDPESGGTNGDIFTQAHLTIDHELLRNVFLQARGGVEYAQYLQNGGGDQTQFTVGAGVNWLLNRNVRLSLDYDYTKLTGSAGVASTSVEAIARTSSAFSLSVATLAVHIAL